jgi:hypothetical protein
MKAEGAFCPENRNEESGKHLPNTKEEVRRIRKNKPPYFGPYERFVAYTLHSGETAMTGLNTKPGPLAVVLLAMVVMVSGCMGSKSDAGPPTRQDNAATEGSAVAVAPQQPTKEVVQPTPPPAPPPPRAIRHNARPMPKPLAGAESASEAEGRMGANVRPASPPLLRGGSIATGGNAVAPMRGTIEKSVQPQIAAKARSGEPAQGEGDQTALEKALAALKTGTLAYNTPERMKVEQTAHIVAKIASEAVSAEALKAQMPQDAGTNTEMASTAITPKMKMTLTGADFTITPLSSEEQMVVGSVPTTWAWDIVPKHSGKLRLHLAAVIELNGMVKDFTTVDRDIAVQVDAADMVGDFVRGNWQWLIATLTALVGGLWKFFHGRKKGAAKEG